MSGIIKPGQGLLYMKVGTHARESLEDIIARKTKEIEDAGLAFWGYGGNTCHPQTMVQPFAKKYERQGEVIYLCMQPMESKGCGYFRTTFKLRRINTLTPCERSAAGA